MEVAWAVKLFRKSILKQEKLDRISEMLGPTDGLRCLDVGSDNGVLCYLLRQRGGSWKSADLDERSVAAMRELVETDVYRIGDGRTPFEEDEFDCVVVVDFLEHIQDDAGFIGEVYRILKPGGTLILNAPNLDTGLLGRVREAIGLTEAEHGHVRPGYSLDAFKQLLGDRFSIESSRTYTKFLSKLADTLMVYGVTWLKRKKPELRSGRGVLVTGKDLDEHGTLFRAYSLVYPAIRLFSQLDRLLPAGSGYMIITRARSSKPDRLEARGNGRFSEPAYSGR